MRLQKMTSICIFVFTFTLLSYRSNAIQHPKSLPLSISVACFDSTVKSAIQKILKDSNTINSDLDLIGLQADKCLFNPKTDSIECFNQNKDLVFTVELENLSPLPATKDTRSYLFSFRTGNENINIIYDIEVTKYINSQKCEVTRIDSHTELPQ